MSKGAAWLLGGAVLAMLVSALALPNVCGLGGGRQAAAIHLLAQLELAVESYEKAFGEYPPGDGSGTRDLVRAIWRPKKGGPCWQPEPEPSIEGDLRNPLRPDSPAPEGVVRYRRNPPGSKPPYRLFLSDGRGGELSAP